MAAMHGMEPVAYTCGWNWGRGFQQSSFEHAWTTEKKASSVVNCIITQIWHQDISTGRQNLSDCSSPLALIYSLEPAPLSSDHWPANLPSSKGGEKEWAFYQGQSRSPPPPLSLKNCHYWRCNVPTWSARCMLILVWDPINASPSHL